MAMEILVTVEIDVADCASNSAVSNAAENNHFKLSHRKWRSKLKQLKRKEKRQTEAQSREENQLDAGEVESTVEDDYAKRYEQWAEHERQYQHDMWLQREAVAQAMFLAKKDREEKERMRQDEEEKRIKAEWEERERREREEEEEKKRLSEEKKSRQDELLKEATVNERKKGDDGVWHNPPAPAGYSADGPERPMCPFFSKVGACRFGDRCSRTHTIPEESCTLLFAGMYANFELEQSMRDEYDTDLTLEFEDSELYQHFESFYQDILPEFKAIGRVLQLKVCCNYEPHLRGNVYVQYASRDEALEAFAKFNGRWYASRQLSCRFTCVNNWRTAICGLFHQRKCPKGRRCNFLHVFRNPGNEFREADNFINRTLVSCMSDWRSPRGESRRDDRHRSVRRSYSRSVSYRANTDRQKSSSRRHHERSRSRSRSRSLCRSRSRHDLLADKRESSHSRPHKRKREKSRSKSRSNSLDDGHKHLRRSSSRIDSIHSPKSKYSCESKPKSLNSKNQHKHKKIKKHSRKSPMEELLDIKSESSALELPDAKNSADFETDRRRISLIKLVSNLYKSKDDIDINVVLDNQDDSNAAEREKNPANANDQTLSQSASVPSNSGSCFGFYGNDTVKSEGSDCEPYEVN